MHKIVYSIREIAAADLPRVRDLDGAERAATVQELLNLGIQHVQDDFYSCAEQLRSDDDTDIVEGPSGRLERRWNPVGTPVPGAELAAGRLVERYAKLPREVQDKVLRATVIRAAGGAVARVEASLLEQATVIEEFVGDVRRGGTVQPLVDFERDAIILEEAQRLAAIPDNGIERMTIALGDVDRAGDVVEADRVIPHAWAGERMPQSGRAV